MTTTRILQFIALTAICLSDASARELAAESSQEKRHVSPGDTAYHVNPATGDDAQAGTAPGSAWKSFARVNALTLSPGDKVMIAPGLHSTTLAPSGRGTAEKPLEIVFAPGVHEFSPEHAIRLPMFVSNSCDAPDKPAPIAILVRGCDFMHLRGDGAAKILLGGRMVEFFNDHSENITYSGLTFDLKRPTVSELRVMETAENSAVIRIAEGSTYAIKDRSFAWTGDIGNGPLLVQLAIPAEGKCRRLGKRNPITTAKAEDLGNATVRLTYASGRNGMETGYQYQFRNTTRDVVSAHNNRCKDIAIRDCEFHALPGMGIVSQFTNGITYERVRVAPPQGTIRTCPAWADIFHFSGCRGRILINECVFSGSQDDAVNVHGTHLRIVGKPAENQLQVRFMHRQTFGFAAFATGDEVAVIDHAKLREHPENPRRKVTAVERLSDKDWLLTLDGSAPHFEPDDVLDNLTWYPDVTIRKCRVEMNSCRGFLLTTRGKVLVEHNTFDQCAMPAILVENDAEGWFESGPVRDMTIRHNRFIHCGISINPRTRSNDPNEPVHENIRIENNFFQQAGITAKSTRGLTITGNSSPDGNLTVSADSSCSEVKLENNAIKEAASTHAADGPPPH
jgi:hypothetical protein